MTNISDKAEVRTVRRTNARLWLLSLPFALLPTPALADGSFYVFLALVRVLSWWVLLITIAIEAGALRYIFGLSQGRALRAATLINVGTGVLVIFVYPIVGEMFHPVLEQHGVKLFGGPNLSVELPAPFVVNIFGVRWNAEVEAVSVVTAIIDTPIKLTLLAVLSVWLGYGIRIGWKAVFVFFITSLVSASILFATLYSDIRIRWFLEEPPENFEQGDADLEQLRRLSVQGDAEAQVSLGFALSNGVARDFAEAVYWYRLAAEQGDDLGQYNLGIMYAKGEGVPHDYGQAVQWFQLAAKQGFVPAQSKLSLMYYRGWGVRQDNVSAYMWSHIAHQNGGRGSFGNEVTFLQEVEAQDRARVCINSNYQDCD